MRRCLALAVAALLVGSCEPAGGVLRFEDLCHVDHSNEVVIVKGFLDTADPDISCRQAAGSLECMLEFSAMPRDTSFVSAYVRTGHGANLLAPPASPGGRFLLRTHDGEPLNPTDRVRLTGLAYVHAGTDTSEAVCALREVSRVERAGSQ